MHPHHKHKHTISTKPTIHTAYVYSVVGNNIATVLIITAVFSDLTYAKTCRPKCEIIFCIWLQPQTVPFLKEIADYILEGPGVWYHVEGGNFVFHTDEDDSNRPLPSYTFRYIGTVII